MAKVFLPNLSRAQFDRYCHAGSSDLLQPHGQAILDYIEHSSSIDVARILPSLFSHPKTADWFLETVQCSTIANNKIRFEKSDYHPMNSISLIYHGRLRGPHALALAWFSTHTHFLGIQSLTHGWIKDAKPHVFLNYLLRMRSNEKETTFTRTMSFSMGNPTDMLGNATPMVLLGNGFTQEALQQEHRQYQKILGKHVGLARFSKFIQEYWSTKPENPEPCLLTLYLGINHAMQKEWTPTLLHLLRGASKHSPREVMSICVLSLYYASRTRNAFGTFFSHFTENEHARLYAFLDDANPTGEWRHAIKAAIDIGIMDSIFQQLDQHPWFVNPFVARSTQLEYNVAEDVVALVDQYFPKMHTLQSLDIDFDLAL